MAKTKRVRMQEALDRIHEAWSDLQDITNREPETDACLINQAAPEMYEALREIWILTATKCHNKENRKINDLASKPLSKAEGK